jgi:3-oxoadipate enol-lactonase
MKIKANGIQINYRVEGPEGAPWVTFSNSLFTNLTMWDAQAAALKDSFRVLRYDQRGHGETEVTPGPYSIDLLADDVLGLLDALGIAKTHYVGISMGGNTGMLLASRQSDRLASLVASDARPQSMPTAREEWNERIAIWREDGIEKLMEITIKRWFHPDFVASNDSRLDAMREMMRTTPLEGYAGGAGALMHYDYLDTLPSFRLPTLFVAGSHDGQTPATLREVHTRVPGATFVEIDRAGHLSSFEQPEAFNRAMLAFLQPLAARAAV